MNSPGPSTPFPLDLDAIMAPGMAESLSALELGAAVRLAAAAWREPEPCTLSADSTFLAMVARITDNEWDLASRRVLLALQASPGAEGQVCFARLRSVHEQLTAKAAAISRQRSLAGRGNAKGEPAGGTARQRPVDGPLTGRSGQALGAPLLRSDSSEALSLNRSHQSAIPSAPEGDVIARLGEGARAILRDRITAWRREKSLAMLEKALAEWSAAGHTTCPISKARELVEAPSAEPARVETLIEYANSAITQAKARRERCNPVGILIKGLGLATYALGQLAEIDLFRAQAWAAREADTAKVLQLEAAIRANAAARAAENAAAGGRRS